MNFVYVLIFCLFNITNGIIITKINPKPRFCVDCIYFIKDDKDIKYSKCSLFARYEEDYLVSGVFNPENYLYCSTARSYGGKCGIEAKMYKDKKINEDNKNK